MEKEYLEKAVRMNGVNNMVIQARVQALEQIFFGYLKGTETEDMAEGLRQQYYRSYAENLESILVHATPADSEAIEMLRAEIKIAWKVVE